MADAIIPLHKDAARRLKTPPADHHRKPVLANNFKVIRQLSRSPKGEVLLVETGARDFQTVVKTIVLEPFLQRHRSCEAELQLLCNLPNVIQVLDHEIHQSTLYIEMEYIGGGSLADLLGKGFIPVSESLHYIRHVLSALTEVHNQGIVHRDIGAENIIVSNGTAKLTDFGSAAHLKSGKTASDLVYAPYIPPGPETLQTFSEATDVFAVGLTLLRSTNNMPKFHTMITNIRRRILDSENLECDTMEDFIPCGPHVPDRLRDIIRKAVRFRRPGYQSARAMKMDLDRLRIVRDWRRAGNGCWLCTYRGRQEKLELRPGLIPSLRYTVGDRQRFQKIFSSSSAALQHQHRFVSETTLA